jgi:hypothetical protein
LTRSADHEYDGGQGITTGKRFTTIVPGPADIARSAS